MSTKNRTLKGLNKSGYYYYVNIESCYAAFGSISKTRV